MTSYYEGDHPAEPIVIVPARDGDEVDLDLYATAVGALIDPTGATLECPATIVRATDLEEGHVELELPLLERAGLHYLEVRLADSAGRVESFEAEPVVVQDRSGWHTIGSAHADWEGSQALSDARLYELLQVARIECVAYAPKLPEGARPPVNYRSAQLTHARNRAAAARVDPATGAGGSDGFAIGAFPLDWTVKQMLRPDRRLGRVR